MVVEKLDLGERAIEELDATEDLLEFDFAWFATTLVRAIEAVSLQLGASTACVGR